jgi:LPS export ABC transporter protein LptC
MYPKGLLKIILSINVTVFTVALFFGCQSNFKDIQKINFTEFMPSGEADSINLKHTDSGKIKAILVSPKLLDYATVDYPFSEFPKGIQLTLFDENNQRNYIVADYAINYKKTNIIDLRGRVKLTSYDGKFLETDQLYYDQNIEWFYTDKPFKFTAPNEGETTGVGIDFSKDFKRVTFKQVKALIEEIPE